MEFKEGSYFTEFLSCNCFTEGGSCPYINHTPHSEILFQSLKDKLVYSRKGIKLLLRMRWNDEHKHVWVCPCLGQREAYSTQILLFPTSLVTMGSVTNICVMWAIITAGSLYGVFITYKKLCQKTLYRFLSLKPPSSPLREFSLCWNWGSERLRDFVSQGHSAGKW